MPRPRYSIDMREHLLAPQARPVVDPSRRAIVVRPAIRPRLAVPRQRSAALPIDIDPDALILNAGPYEGYGRILTAAGGILITFKDRDLRWRHTIWRVAAWSAFTGFELWLTQNLPAGGPGWLAYLALLAAAVLNWLILRKPAEVLRQIEIRPDCLIFEGAEVFWRRFMEGELPSLKPDAEGNLILSGIYGTRHVEFATLRRFDEHDRSPEVFAAHIEEAFAQLWSRDR